jgi:hypothetical protein
MVSKSLPAVFLLLATASVHAATVVLLPVRDNTMYAENGAQSNGAGENFFAGRNGMNQTRRGLIAFSLAGIPAGSTITAVSLEMYCSKAAPGSAAQGIRLYRLLKSWGEGGSNGGVVGEGGQGAPAQTGDATWTQRFFAQGIAWATAGGEFVATSSASTLVGAPGEYYTWSSAGMVADVQGWLNSPATNQGWIVRGNETAPTTARRFGSKDNGFAGFRPHLSLTFNPPATSPGATPDGDSVPGNPLLVERLGSGQLELSWGASCVATVNDYAVYQGPIGTFNAHTPVVCSTTGALSQTLSPPSGSVYWLAVPVDPTAHLEGSYGKRSDGSEIPPSGGACFPQLTGASCP